MEKIAKCLALSESSNENEARTALLMARRLMAEYKISDLSEAVSKDPEERQTPITFTTIRNNWVIDLTNAIGPRYCCKPYTSRRYGKKTRYACFLGFPEDLDVCVPAFELAVSTIMMNIRVLRLSKEEGDSYARGFIQGLKDAYAEQDRKMSSDPMSTALVSVMDIPREVKEYADNSFRRENIRVRAYQRDDIAYDSGLRDGLNHNKRRLSGNARLLR